MGSAATIELDRLLAPITVLGCLASRTGDPAAEELLITAREMSRVFSSRS